MSDVTLIAAEAAEETIAWRDAAPISRHALATHAGQLAELMPAHGYVVNLADDRYLFLVGLLAALLRQQILLLPPGRAPDALSRLQERYPDSYALIEPGTARPPINGWKTVEIPAPLPGSVVSALKLPEQQPAALVFTSGSTGMPSAHLKTVSALTRAASSIAERLLLIDSPGRTNIVSTVPHQHMYGLETSIALPLMTLSSIHSGRPLFPEDVRVALAALPAPRFLVTTPVHLRALLASGITFPALKGVLSATAPLAQADAHDAELRFGCPLWELYGFSEAGSVATRRPTHHPQWHLLRGLSLCGSNGADLSVAADYLPDAIRFPDIVARVGEDRLLLHGRGADVVNIGGHRASLQELNQKLITVAGVEDGVFMAPPEGENAGARMTAFVVAPKQTVEQVLNGIRAVIDPAFLPRPLFLVPALPRNATGKLTRAALEELTLACLARSGAERDTLV